MVDNQTSLLVVDDNEMNRDMLSRRLERRGYAVTVAHDGPHALQLIRDSRFELVLLDVMMPGMNGLDVLKLVRETQSATDLPIIMATARGGSDDIVNALELGANDYVTKPLDFPVVLARVETHLALKRAAELVKQLERNLAERNRELQESNTLLEKVNGRMSRDLKAAAMIQATFLPGKALEVPGMVCDWVYRPCDELGGDGLNIIPLGKGCVGLYILDVSGHGVVSALLSVALSRVLSPPPEPASILVRDGEHADRSELTPPAAVADQLNRLFPFDAATGQFATMLYGILDIATGEFRYASAGHPGPVHLPAGGSPVILESEGFPIGLADEAYEERSIHLAAGDRLYIYSDGVPEAMDLASNEFGNDRLMEAIHRHGAESLQQSVAALFAATERWRGEGSARDDLSILAIEVMPTARADVESQSSTTGLTPGIAAGQGCLS